MDRLTKKSAEVGVDYKSAINPITNGSYKILKLNDKTCDVELIEDGEETGTIYKNVTYNTFYEKK